MSAPISRAGARVALQRIALRGELGFLLGRELLALLAGILHLPCRSFTVARRSWMSLRRSSRRSGDHALDLGVLPRDRRFVRAGTVEVGDAREAARFLARARREEARLLLRDRRRSLLRREHRLAFVHPVVGPGLAVGRPSGT
jgi:hypothetical protein